MRAARKLCHCGRTGRGAIRQLAASNAPRPPLPDFTRGCSRGLQLPGLSWRPPAPPVQHGHKGGVTVSLGAVRFFLLPHHLGREGGSDRRTGHPTPHIHCCWPPFSPTPPPGPPRTPTGGWCAIHAKKRGACRACHGPLSPPAGRTHGRPRDTHARSACRPGKVECPARGRPSPRPAPFPHTPNSPVFLPGRSKRFLGASPPGLFRRNVGSSPHGRKRPRPQIDIPRRPGSEPSLEDDGEGGTSQSTHESFSRNVLASPKRDPTDAAPSHNSPSTQPEGA